MKVTEVCFSFHLARNYFFLLMVLWLGIMRCANNKIDPVVAQSGEIKISLSTFSRTLMDRLKWSPLQVQDSPELRKQVVLDLVTRHRLAQKARQARLDQRPEFHKAMQAESTAVIIHGLWQQEIGDKLKPENIRDEELLAAYKKMSMKFHVRHLVAKSKPAIDSLYQRLRYNTPFAVLAQECFRDSTLRQNPGDLGMLTWGDFDDISLEDAVFQLKVGQYSKPIESKYGWHILYLENLVYNPILTEQDYLTHKNSIRNRIWRRRLKQMSDERVKALMQSKNIRINVPVILELEKAQRRLQNNGLIAFRDITEVADMPLENLLDRRSTAVAARYDGGQWTVADMRRYLATVSPEALHSGLYRTAATSLRNYFLLQLAQQQHIDKVPSVSKEIDDKREHLLSASFWAAYTDTCSFRNEDEKRYYESHKNQFLLDRDMTVLEILLRSESEAYRVRSLLQTEQDFRDYARQYTLRPGMREKEGLLGVIKKSDYGEIGAAAFKQKPGAVRGPVVASKDGFSLLLVLDAQDHYAPFIAVKDDIARTMQQQKKIFTWEKLRAESTAKDSIMYSDQFFSRDLF